MAESKSENKTPVKNRRMELVAIAYRHIAERGFEGLRIHDVAGEAGINNATLHYYFPTKEALIQGVVDFMIHEFSAYHDERPGPPPATALDELRQEFDDARQRLLHNLDQIVIFTELLNRSLRDPAIAGIFAQFDDSWRGYLESLLKTGVREGIFRPDLDAKVTATAIMAQIKGFGLQMVDKTDLDIAEDVLTLLEKQVEASIVIKEL